MEHQPKQLPLPNSSEVHPATLGLQVVDAENVRVAGQIGEERLHSDGLKITGELEQQDAEETEWVSPVPLGSVAIRAAAQDKKWLRSGRLHSSEAIKLRKQVAAAESTVSNGLSEVRTRMAQLSDTGGRLLTMYAEANVPEFFVKIKEDSGAESWKDWLSHASSDVQLINFLQWHVDNLEKQSNNPEFSAQVAEQKEYINATVKKGVESGWLDDSCITGLETVEDAKIFVGDIFDTFIAGNAGNFRYQGNVIAIGARPSDSKGLILTDKTVHVIRHELIHSLLSESSLNHIGIVDWIEEAITEHLTQSLENGQPEEIWPGNRSDISRNQDIVYSAERQLLSTMTGIGKIDGRFVTRCLTGGSKEHAKLWKAVDELWGVLNVRGAIQVAMISKMKQQLGDNGWRSQGPEVIRAQHDAAYDTWRVLREQPETIFGAGYKKP